MANEKIILSQDTMNRLSNEGWFTCFNSKINPCFTNKFGSILKPRLAHILMEEGIFVPEKVDIPTIFGYDIKDTIELRYCEAQRETFYESEDIAEWYYQQAKELAEAYGLSSFFEEVQNRRGPYNKLSQDLVDFFKRINHQDIMKESGEGTFSL